MASTSRSVRVVGQNDGVLDTGSFLRYTWTERNDGEDNSGDNTFAIRSEAQRVRIVLTGNSGDTIYIEGASDEYQYKLSGRTLTLKSDEQTITIVLPTNAKTSTVATSLVFLDGELEVTKASGTRTFRIGSDEGRQNLTSKYRDLTTAVVNDSNDDANDFFNDLSNGDTFTLTTDGNQVVGTDDNDIIYGSVHTEFNNSTDNNENLGTFDVQDSIDGGDGVDTLSIISKYSYSGEDTDINLENVQNVENFEFRNVSSNSLYVDFAQVSGEEKVTIKNSTDYVSIENMGSGTDVVLSSNGEISNGTVYLEWNSNEDTANINIDGGYYGGNLTIEGYYNYSSPVPSPVDGMGLTTINLSSTGNPNSINNLYLNTNHGYVNTLNLSISENTVLSYIQPSNDPTDINYSGLGDITINSLDTEVTSFVKTDTSTGGTVSIYDVGSWMRNIVTGASDDYIDATDAQDLYDNGSVTIATNAGDDTLRIGTATYHNVNLGDGDDYLQVANIDGIDVSDILNGGNNIDIIDVASDNDVNSDAGARLYGFEILETDLDNDTQDMDVFTNSTITTVKQNQSALAITDAAATLSTVVLADDGVTTGSLARKTDTSADVLTITNSFTHNSREYSSGSSYTYSVEAGSSYTASNEEIITINAASWDTFDLDLETSTDLTTLDINGTYVTGDINIDAKLATNLTLVTADGVSGYSNDTVTVDASDSTVNLTYVGSSTVINVVTSGSGNDSILGGGSNDTISSGDGNDTIDALGGNDTINAGSGNNFVTAGDGNDSVTTTTGADTISGGSGNDTINAGAGANSVSGGDGNDSITTTTDNDTIDGGSGNDTINAGAGNNSVLGGQGDDSITTDSGDDTISAGDGADTISAGDGANSITGGNGNDTITATNGADTIDGGANDDTINAGAGNNNVSGGSGNDSITTTTGNDTIDGGDNNDTITAGAGNDSIVGGSGSDSISAGDGNDIILGDDSDSLIDGGNNTDTLRINANFNDVNNAQIINIENIQLITDSLNVDLSSQTENLTITTSNGQNTLVAGTGHDYITGGTGNDSINANSGNDSINGFAGADTINGGDGTDRLIISSTSSDLNVAADGQITYVEVIDVESASEAVSINLSSQTEGFTIVASTGASYADSIVGSQGNDIFQELVNRFVSSETLNGGNGTDTIEFTDAGTVGDGAFVNKSNFEIIKLANGTNNLTLSTAATSATSDLTVNGGTGADTINASGLGSSLTVNGGSGTDSITGSNSDDEINGDGGNDTIIAGSGSDTINGGDGVDTLTGGDDADLFMLTGIVLSGDRDIITDFTQGDDLIVLDENETTVSTLPGGVPDFETIAVVGDDAAYNLAGLINTAETDIVEFTNLFSGNGDLDSSSNGTELLKLLADTGGDTADSITLDNTGDSLYLIAYDNSKAYIYLATSTDDVVVTATEIQLVGTVNNIAVGALNSASFLMS